MGRGRLDVRARTRGDHQYEHIRPGIPSVSPLPFRFALSEDE